MARLTLHEGHVLLQRHDIKGLCRQSGEPEPGGRRDRLQLCDHKRDRDLVVYDVYVCPSSPACASDHIPVDISVTLEAKSTVEPVT